MSISFDLPMPPSVNSIWRIGKSSTGKRSVYLDKKYVAWRNQAETLLMASGVIRGHITIDGQFDAVVILDSTKRRGDADNRLKCPLDLCQRIGIVSNDKNCRKASIEWGDAPLGCHVTITEVGRQEHDTSLCNDAMRKAAARQEDGTETAGYDANKDFAGSLDEGYGAIRQRKAAGGPGWTPKGDVADD